MAQAELLTSKQLMQVSTESNAEANLDVQEVAEWLDLRLST